MEEQPEFMVCVRCFTFNQVNYITDAMNGFCIQETNFPFVCTIVDDASTDGEQEVIRKYLKAHFNLEDKTIVRNEETNDHVLTFARHKTNKNCFFAMFYLKYNHYSIRKAKRQYLKDWVNKSKYSASCEGDDYWISPYKLQRQVDFLESHPNYTACFHNALLKYENHSRDDKLMCNFNSGDFDTAQIVEIWQLPLASLLTKNIVFDSDEFKQISTELGGGYSSFLAASRLGKTYGFSEVMSVYRKNDGGVSNTFKGHPDVVWDINFKYAYFFNDKKCKIVFDKKAEKALIEKYLLQYFKRKEIGIKVVNVICKYNKTILYKAIIKYPIYKLKNLTIGIFNKILEL